MRPFEARREVIPTLEQKWDAHAKTWDAALRDPGHFTRIENHYPRFLQLEETLLSSLPQLESGADFGAGTGESTGPLARKVNNLYLIDISKGMLEEAGRKFPGAKLLHESVLSTSLVDRSMDVVISRGVLVSHLAERGYSYLEFLQEIRRVIKPNGLMLIDFFDNYHIPPLPGHLPKKTFTIEEMRKQLDAFGFQNIQFDGTDENRVVRVSAYG